MHLYFDTTAEFAAACCKLLRAADHDGPLLADWFAAAATPPGFDEHTHAWLEALGVWDEPAQAAAAIGQARDAILATGRAHHRLLADMTLALADGAQGEALLERMAPWFAGIDLPARVPALRAAADAHKDASDRRLRRWLAEIQGAEKPADEIVVPPQPERCIEPDAAPELRAAALIGQLLPVLPPTRIAYTPLAAWSLGDQRGPVARFVKEYCRFDVPDDLPMLLQRQIEAADRALELKLALLEDTLSGILARRLLPTVTRLAAHFDGELPGQEIVRGLRDPEYGDAAATLRLDAALDDGSWRIACAGQCVDIGDASCDALAAALENLLDRDLALQAPVLAADFAAVLESLVALDDRTFQCFLREMQSATLELMLTGLPAHRPQPPDFDEIHPFHRQCADNISRVAWQFMENDIAKQGAAALDAFELAEVLGVLTRVRPDMFQSAAGGSRLSALFRRKDKRPAPRPIDLPDMPVAADIAFTERHPRQATVAIAACRWQVNIDALRLLGCQLRHREVLRTAGAAAFARAWAGAWLTAVADAAPARRRRFLRAYSRREAALLTTPADGDWPEIARLILIHPMFASLPVF